MNRILACLKNIVKFCETITQFASSYDNLTQILLILHNEGNLEPTPTILQMHKTYKNARDQKKTKNNTSSTKKNIHF
jgi:hypothetical protein